jgi:hypothetical protein
MYTYMSTDPPTTFIHFLTTLEKARRDPTSHAFAIIDKHPDGPQLAGMLSYENTEAASLALEIGAVFVFSHYQVCLLATDQAES